jgi:C4-dicarboxylate-specific signal transduction histidine kinase
MNSNRNSSPTDLALDRSLAFSGAITASVTHELNNVLGTIEQVNGLIEDLCFSPDMIQAGIVDKLTSVAERINRQTERGTSLIKSLNTFAHLADRGTEGCNLNYVLENITSLMQRLAGLKKIQLALQEPDTELDCAARPFLVGQVIFECIKRLVSATDPNSTITVSLSSGDGVPEIRFKSMTGGTTNAGLLDDELLALAAGTPAEIEEPAPGDDEGVCLRVRFAAPTRAPGSD